MGAISALRPTVRGVSRNPSLFVVIGLFGLLQLPQLFVQTIDPDLAVVVSLAVAVPGLFITPFYQAGLLGMAVEALEGHTSVGTFASVGKDNYVAFLLAYVLLLASVIIFVIITSLIIIVVSVVLGGAAVLADPTGGSLLFVAVFGLIGLALASAYFLAVFFVQFYGQAIVLDDLGVVDAFKRSVGLVRRNLLSTFGYTLLVGAVGLGVGVVGMLIQWLVTPSAGTLATSSSTMTSQTMMTPEQTLSTTGFVALALLNVIGSALLGSFFATYSVAFYRDLRASAA